MRLRSFLALGLLLSSYFASSASAEIDFIKVVEIQGRADVYDPSSSQWILQTSTPVRLKEGSRLRTYPDSSAQIIMSNLWDTLIYVAENSRISVLDSSLSRISLDEGHVYVLCEDDSRSVTSLKFLTKDALIELTVAGVGIRSDAAGTKVQTFADFVTIFPRKSGKYGLSGESLPEGFQAMYVADAEANAPARMTFDDYWKWQAWLKARYVQKDKLLSKRANR